MSGRPPGPKKLAAIEQVTQLRAAKMPDADIREALVKSGLTRQQAKELVPLSENDKLGLPAPMIVTPPDSDAKKANIEGAIHFLETIAKRVTSNAIDRFPELRDVRNDSLTWARKLRGVL